MLARKASIVFGLVFAFAGVACSDEPAVTSAPTGGTATGSSGQTGTPSSEPPWGLDTIEMPNDAQAVLSTVGALPQMLGGLDRAEATPTEVYYGNGDTYVRAIDLTEAHSEGFPDTVPAYLDLLASSGEVQVEEQQTDPNADFVYLVDKNTVQDSPDAEPRTTFDAAWGASDGTWLFVASASSEEERAAIADAFRQAASG